MKVIKNESLPSKEVCAGTLKNVVDALYVLNGKWKLLIIVSLMQASKRFNELQQDLNGISAKVLAKELKDLELNDLVERIVIQTNPPTSIYQATAYSGTLKNVMTELGSWGQQHREKLKQSMRKQS